MSEILGLSIARETKHGALASTRGRKIGYSSANVVSWNIPELIHRGL